MPFRWTVGFPVKLLLGPSSPREAIFGILTQTIWLAVGLVLVRVTWRAGVIDISI